MWDQVCSYLFVKTILTIYLDKGLFSEAVPHSFCSKICSTNMQHIYRRPYGNVISKCCVALLHGCCSTVKLLQIWRTPYTSEGLLLCFISFVSVEVINSTFYRLTFIIYRQEFVDWSNVLWRFSSFYDKIFEIISKLYAVTGALVIFSSQSLVKCPL